MKILPSSLAPAGYSPNRLNPLSLTKVSDQGQRLTDLRAIQQLFANGEDGGYWPADPAYLFDDSTGTIPASVNGVVGCWYDAHYRLKELGSEVFSTFPTPTISDYSGTSGVWNSGTRTMTNPGAPVTGYPRFRFLIPLVVAGRRYFVSGSYSRDISKLSQIRLATTGAASDIYRDVANGLFYGEAKAAIGVIEFVLDNIVDGMSVTIESLSIKQVLGNHAIQATTANKPYLRKTPVSNKFWLDSNTATGALTATFASSLGSACTIATVGAEGVVIADNQTVGTTYNLAPPFGYNGDVLIINRALTAAEKALVTRVMQRNVPMLGSESVVNGAFDTDSGWTIGSGFGITISGGQLNFDGVTNVTSNANILSRSGPQRSASYGIFKYTNALSSGIIGVTFGSTYPILPNSASPISTSLALLSSASNLITFYKRIATQPLSGYLDNLSFREII